MSDEDKIPPSRGRQLEFNRSNFAASERQLEPLTNDDYEAFDDDNPSSSGEIEDYPSYDDEVVDYQPAAEDLFDDVTETDPTPRWDADNDDVSRRWYEPTGQPPTPSADGDAASAEDTFATPDDDAAQIAYDSEPDYDLVLDEEPIYDSEPDEEFAAEPESAAAPAAMAAPLNPPTRPSTDYSPTADQQPQMRKTAGIPLGLLATAVVALLLLAVGGYGIMQQRATMQEEIRILQSRLAAADAAAASTANEASAAQTAVLAQLQQTVTALEQQNRMLDMDNAALQEKLAALQAQRRLSAEAASPEENLPAEQAPQADTPAARPKPVPTPATTVARQPARTQEPAPARVESPANTTASGPWFVNFAAYSSEENARRRAETLEVGERVVRVLPVNVDGRTLYRVRVTGLPDREQADALARELEKNYGVSRLWVGKN